MRKDVDSFIPAKVKLLFVEIYSNISIYTKDLLRIILKTSWQVELHFVNGIAPTPTYYWQKKVNIALQG